MRLLLDSHLPVALGKRLRDTGLDVVALSEWLGGDYRTASDDRVLEAALADHRVLVTYDCRTIPRLLKDWAESGRHHAGVVLVDEVTIRPSDVGGLLRALTQLAERSQARDCADRVVFLRAVRR